MTSDRRRAYSTRLGRKGWWCPGGWPAVELRDGGFAEARAVTNLRSLLPVAVSGGVAVVAVDMPLGLVETGWRRADTEAAALLGPLRRSVLRVPPRAYGRRRRTTMRGGGAANSPGPG